MEQKEKKKLSFPVLIKIIKKTIQGIGEDRVVRVSGSLAFATLFSIIPLFSIIAIIGSIFQFELDVRLFNELQAVLGPEAVEQLQPILQESVSTEFTNLTAIISLGVTLFGATTIFAVLQSSLNVIWHIKPVPKKGWLKFLKNRLLSFSIILVLAFLLLVTFTITNFITNFTDRIMADFQDVALVFVKIIGTIFNIGVTTFIFVLIFKVLPDAKIKTKDVLVGAIVTTVLFLVGQWGISVYFGLSNVGSVYGVAAFLAIFLTWIYYSAIIVFVGAEFTQAWANEMGSKIYPDEYAVATKVVEIKKEGKPITNN
ncbi:MAG: YihY/virulence factor BrkB family protein [Fermentimonas sp.]|nr:YihY/virulence factor BrkB family protein [Fermentimonas sp.]